MSNDLIQFKVLLFESITSKGLAWTFRFGPEKVKGLSILNKYSGKDRAKYAFLVTTDMLIPVCPQCGSECKFKSFSLGFARTCGNIECVTKEKTKHNSPFKNPKIQKKAQQTIIKKYGGMGAASLVIKNKMRETSRKSTGFDSNFSKGTKSRQEIDAHFEKEYGGHPLSNREVRNHIKNTLFEKYGVTNINEIPDIHNKSGKTKAENRKKEIEQNENLEILSYNGYDYEFKCCVCNYEFEYTQNIFKDRKINICPKCYPRIFSGISKGQGEVKEFVESLGFSVLSNDRTIISPLEIDIFIPDKNVAIEYCGLYWHSELFRDKNYHFNKWDQCNDKGIRLVSIFENDWTDSKDKIKNILKTVLLDNNQIGARKTTVSTIDKKTANCFLERNHLQGFSGKHCYGLFYNDNLISVATFNEKRNIFGDRGQGFEIVRFATEKSVIGGLNKIIKLAQKELGFELLTSFCDLRYFTGSVYENSGFNKGKTTIGYWYFDGQKLRHRFSCTKQKLVELAKQKNINIDGTDTESTLYKKMNLVKIYDCGQVKYVKSWSKGVK